MRRLLERINILFFAVLAVSLAVAFGVSGLTVLASSGLRSAVSLPLAVIESAAMVLSAACLILTFILWAIASIMGVHETDTPGTVHLFDRNGNSDHTV